MKKISLTSEINHKNRIFILSIGQLTESKFGNVIKNLSSILAKNSLLGENFGYYSNYIKTSAIYGLHEVSHARLSSRLPNIPYILEKKKEPLEKTNELLLYKEGKISEQDFISLLRSKLNINLEVTDNEILDAWKTGFEIDDENLDKIVESIKNAQEKKYVLAIVCSLDPSSYQKFLSQINPKLQAENMKEFEENDHILTVRSFEEKVSGKNTLARILVQKYELDRPEMQLVSLYKHIKPTNIETKNTQLIYKPIDHQTFGWYSSIPQLLDQGIFKTSEKSMLQNISPLSLPRSKSKENLCQISE